MQLIFQFDLKEGVAQCSTFEMGIPNVKTLAF